MGSFCTHQCPQLHHEASGAGATAGEILGASSSSLGAVIDVDGLGAGADPPGNGKCAAISPGTGLGAMLVLAFGASAGWGVAAGAGVSSCGVDASFGAHAGSAVLCRKASGDGVGAFAAVCSARAGVLTSLVAGDGASG